LQKIRQHPIIILLAVNILIGLFTFHHYGLSWDEPLFYDYADALGYAYSPREWFSGDFNLENAYGASGSDHANRGPAYILLARGPVFLLEASGLDAASAWHLINFLAFQLGVYLFYRLVKRWVNDPAALAAAALLAWQPLLWGQAFINPKDPPFLVFFLGAMCFGFEMVDEVSQNGGRKTQKILLAAFFLGIATSIRVLGPLAGLLVCLYASSKITKATAGALIKTLLLYAGLTILITFVTWPYLWSHPVQGFIEAFGFMSDNPTKLQVLFNGQLYPADELPRRYLPVLLGLTLTEPVWILFFIGSALALLQLKGEKLFSAILVWLWFLVPLAYVLLRKPPMYDGFRHFLFILPPVFLFAGFAFEKLFSWFHSRWVNIALLAAILLPAVFGIVQLHPYQYTYYNTFIGGMGGAFRKFETDYWLTCYKQAIEGFQGRETQIATIYANREAYIAAYYVKDYLTVLELRGAVDETRTGDFILVNTRANEDLKTFRDAPVVLEVGRAGAIFCVIKIVP
jgi:4-amino-4-deoxy-L-arabinose transferase-like glycosyltransferase